MPPKKRLKKLAEAISEILGDEQKAKKLKKAKVLERFIGKLQDRHREMKREIEKGSLGTRTAKERAREADSLLKQIKKAKKILADMK
jgi:hypothetical protein